VTEWKIYLRDNNYLTQGEIDDYENATFTTVFNDIGSWKLVIDARSPIVGMLANPNWGILITRDGVQAFSGIWVNFRFIRGEDQWNVEFEGVTDEVWLVSRIVSPSPTESSAPYTVQASDVRTGVASTVVQAYVNVNLGPGAVPARRKNAFTLAADPNTGFTVKGEARWDSDLLAFIQPLATTGGIGFRVVQVGAGIQFQTYWPGDKSASVKYSVDLGNLESYEFTRGRPKGNYFFIGASGTGVSRIIKEVADSPALATWERIEGQLVNVSSTSDTTVITQAGTDAIAQNGEEVSLAFSPIEIPDMQYLVHYNVGDKISAQLVGPLPTPYGADGLVVDVVRQVEVSLQKDSQTVTPSFGTPSRGQISRLVKAFQQANVRLNNLERA
jgi:hypothetical protein